MLITYCSFYECSEVMSNVVKRMNFSEVVAMIIITLHALRLRTSAPEWHLANCKFTQIIDSRVEGSTTPWTILYPCYKLYICVCDL